MLPYTTIEFFIYAAASVAFIFVIKYTAGKFIPYHFALLAVSATYMILYFPNQTSDNRGGVELGIFIIYSYLIYYLFVYKIHSKIKLWGILLLTLPMIVIKLHLNIFVLIGSSYITFRSVQLFIDAKENEKPYNFFYYFNFIALLPCLLIGPIDRSERFFADLKKGYNQLTFERFFDGLNGVVWGIGYKFFLALAVQRFWIEQIHLEANNFWQHFQYMYAYSFFLYFDFAGYSSLAVGYGKMLGIDVPYNFDKPFLALNPQEFWRKWHKTLGDWLRDYVFRPIFKELTSRKLFNSRPVIRQNIALFFTFTLMGFWNGFEKHYIVSGMLFGVYSVVHNSYIFNCKKKQKDIFFGNTPPWLVKAISIFIMFNAVCFALYIFSGAFPFLKSN